MILNAIIITALVAIFRRISYALDDYKLDLFRGDRMFFGFMWGLFASYLILFDNTLANVWLAILVGWVLRAKLGEFHNALGATLVLLTFLLNNDSFLFQKLPFLLFFFGAAVSGLIHDILFKKGHVSRENSELLHSIIFYTLLAFFYSVNTGNWIVFASLFTFMLVHEATRHALLMQFGSKRKMATPPRRTVRI